MLGSPALLGLGFMQRVGGSNPSVGPVRISDSDGVGCLMQVVQVVGGSGRRR